MLSDWNIKSRSTTCQMTGEPFEEDQIFYTLLFRNGEEYERLDLCETAWEARKKEATQPMPFSYWRSKYEIPPPPPPEPLKKDDAEGMLRHLLASSDPQHRKTCYILALMLERKKILKPLSSPEASTLLYEHAATGETFIIPDPHLSLQNLLEVQQEVGALLGQSTMSFNLSGQKDSKNDQ